MAVNLLLSYAFHAETDLWKVRRNLVCGRLMIDSGAFTAHSKGRAIDMDEYARFLEAHRGAWDHAVTLDRIGDPATTRVNTHRLHERGLPVMPVFTRGNTLADFDAMVRDVGYVCVGGGVGLPQKAQRARVGMLQRRARDAGGGIHALGVGSMSVLRATRPYSADASSVSGAFRFGTIVYFDGRELRNVSASDRKKLTRDQRHIRAHGIDLALIAREGKLPSKTARGRLMTAMSVAYACADEVLKATGPVPPPRSPAAAPDHEGTHLYNSAGWAYAGPGPVTALDQQRHQGTHLYNSLARFDGASIARTAGLDVDLHDGPHLYNSVTPEWGPPLVADADREAHGPDVPLAWRWYGHAHTCTTAPKEATA